VRFHFCGLYYKPMTFVNDDSRFVNKLEASLTDNARVIIYNCHMFIVQATGRIMHWVSVFSRIIQWVPVSGRIMQVVSVSGRIIQRVSISGRIIQRVLFQILYCVFPFLVGSVQWVFCSRMLIYWVSDYSIINTLGSGVIKIDHIVSVSFWYNHNVSLHLW
jgi:hypothetical protein